MVSGNRKRICRKYISRKNKKNGDIDIYLVYERKADVFDQQTRKLLLSVEFLRETYSQMRRERERERKRIHRQVLPYPKEFLVGKQERFDVREDFIH